MNTGAHGKAVITIDPASGEVTWVIDVFNFPTGLTASHIHVGAAGTAGPVVIDFAPQIIGVSGPFQSERLDARTSPPGRRRASARWKRR